MRHPQLVRTNQKGLVSFIVTFVLMIITSLIILGFAQLTRREQRQVLDRQLNTQAYYAAETGVNDAEEAIISAPSLLASDYTSSCNSFETAANAAGVASVDSSIDSAANTSYSCLLVDPTPTSWEANVGDTARVTPLKDKNGGVVESVTIAWHDVNNETDFSSCPAVGTLPDGNDWSCGAPMLRIELVNTSSLARGDLNSRVVHHFLQPVDAGAVGATTLSLTPSPPSPPPPSNGGPTGVNCHRDNTPRYCVAKINIPNSSEYYLRVRTVYGSATVFAEANDGAGNPYELKESQVVIDSTGKAVDVLRRIQVRIPLFYGREVPEYAISSGDSICKRLIVSGGLASTDSATEAACQP